MKLLTKLALATIMAGMLMFAGGVALMLPTEPQMALAGGVFAPIGASVVVIGCGGL